MSKNIKFIIDDQEIEVPIQLSDDYDYLTPEEKEIQDEKNCQKGLEYLFSEGFIEL